MLRRADSVSCCTTDLLVVQDELFAFCACFPTCHVCVPLAGPNLLSADALLDWNSHL